MSIAESRPLIAMTLQALMNRSILDNQGIDLIAIARLTLVRRPVVLRVDLSLILCAIDPSLMWRLT
jgi:hypothetical protein